MRCVHGEKCPNSCYHKLLEPCKRYALQHLTFFRDEKGEAKCKESQVCDVQRKFNHTRTHIEDKKQGLVSLHSGFLKFRIQYDQNHLDCDGQKDTWDAYLLVDIEPVKLFHADLRRFCSELNLNLLHLNYKEVKDRPSQGNAAKADVPEGAALWVA